jgi:hypothetical protein
MKVVKLGQGTQWTVYATCNADGSCPVLDFICDLDTKRGDKILADLQQYVPHNESRQWIQTEFSWSLRGSDKIYEFRWATKKGGTPRIMWFYDKGKIVVCTHGLNKKGTMDESEIRHAESIAEAYGHAVKTNALQIVEYTEFVKPNKEES